MTLTHPGENMLHMLSGNSEKPLCFDVAWEVCRKVGGIYTVLSTKALVTVQEWGDRYALIGPYYKKTAATEFEPMRPSPMIQTVLEQMEEKHSIKVHFGRWLIKGYPRVLLIDMDSAMKYLDRWRRDLMSGFEAPHDTEVNDAIVFGYASTLLLELVRDNSPQDRPIVSHYHEWQVGVGLIAIKRKNIRIATLFTTHATLLGRYIAAGHIDLYGQLEQINADEAAGSRGIYQRHWIETGAARGSDVFTTVSDITGFEAEHLLKRKPDIITPNGLNMERFTALHEFQNLHKKFKDKIHEFVRGHFVGHHNFDLDKTLYFFTAGRREYHNKGVDLFIESLAELNYMLQQNNSEITVVAFIIMPGSTNNYNVESIEGQSVRREIRETCNRIVKNISSRLYESIMSGNAPPIEELLSVEDMVEIKRRVLSIQAHQNLPPIVTHNMINGENDEVLKHLRAAGLLNQRESKVKVIYHPEFLSATSPVFPLDYHEFIRGCHLGVFASYYEPWGYTPAECAIMGVPSITSNLTGFANFICRRISEPENVGLYIVDRRYKGFEEGKHQMANVMFRFCQLSRRERIALRNKVERVSAVLDWNQLGKHYVKARNMALQKVFDTSEGMPEFYEDDDSLF
uniref:Glycogen [starch] synthase n=1 Tax=Arcella intermedia TaxID=1963864 RepID=A0A6B2KZL5_9EUKA